MTGHGFGGADLSLSHAQNTFFITMIDLDLPSIEINLNERSGATVQVCHQQVSGLPVVDARMRRKLVRLGSDYNQAQLSSAAATFPKHPLHWFVPDVPPVSPKVNLGFSPAPL